MAIEAALGNTARDLLDRAFALAVERGAKVSTLHLAAALMEQGGEGAKVLSARGVRAQDLRSAGKVHPEDAGTFERVQSNAKVIASSRASELAPTHLLVAALGDARSALASMLSQLGCDPTVLAEQMLRDAKAHRGTPGRRPILHSGMIRKTETPTPQPLNLTADTARTPSSSPPAARTPGKIISNPKGANTPQHGVGRQLSLLSGGAPTTTGTRETRTPSGSATTSSHPEVLAPTRSPVIGNGPARTGTPRSPRVEKTEHDLDARTYPALSLLARNLSAEGARGVLEPMVGREKEIRRVLDAVARREGRGALVVGPAGVGKSSLIRALARDSGGRAVLSLRHAEIAAQARGPQGADRVRKLVDELVRAGDRILVAFDPIAPWFLTRDAPDDVVLELRAALAAGKLSWVGTASPEEARKLAETESWLDRSALRVDLEEPTPAELNEMVRAYAPAISLHHGVVADPAVLEHAAELSERYLGGRAQPDRALTVVDLALARARRAKLPALMREDVAGVVAELGGIPYDRVSASDNERLLGLEGHLGSRVVGHGHAMTRVSQILRRNAVGFRGNRPIGTFLFLGPTGVGKTETAKAMAEALFPGVGAMTRFDMAEFSEAHTVARLLGAPPGYVGYHDGGQLTEAVRRRPYQLVLLDEIEKAHRDVLESLLALLDEGRMTDGRGRTIDFRNTVVVMTSNLGADVYTQAATAPARTIGFAPQPLADVVDARMAALDERVRDAARGALPPELWNRIDEPVVFAPLSRDEVTEIAWRLLRQSFARLEQEQGIHAVATPGVVELLLDNGGYEPALGARPMRRAIARLVEAPVAEAVLRGTLRRGDLATLKACDWGIEVLVGARSSTPS